jgi:hypothetical protein
MQGSPEGENLGVYWFSTSTDPIADTGARNAFIYGYHHKGAGKAVEVLKTRVKKDEDPDYWEPSRALTSYGMAKFERPVEGNITALDGTPSQSPSSTSTSDRPSAHSTAASTRGQSWANPTGKERISFGRDPRGFWMRSTRMPRLFRITASGSPTAKTGYSTTRSARQHPGSSAATTAKLGGSGIRSSTSTARRAF